MGQKRSQNATINGAAQKITMVFDPLVAGPFDLHLTATGSGVKDFNGPTKAVRVKQTQNLTIDYIQMDSSFYGMVDINEFNNHITKAADLINGMFPLAENGLTSENELYSIVPAPFPRSSSDAVLTDLEKLGRLAAIKHVPVIGIVSRDYFPLHLQRGTFGIAQTPSTQTGFVPAAAITTVGYWDTTPHELAHTFSVLHAYNAPKVSGYWVDQLLNIKGLTDLMDLSSADGYDVSLLRWISKPEFQQIFKSLLVQKADPEVFLISGFLNADNTISLDPIAYMPNGVVTPFNPLNDVVINISAADGSLLGQSSFASSFSLLGDNGTVIPTNQSAFAVQVPVVNQIAAIEFVSKNMRLAKINPQSQLLITAIVELPDSVFNTDPVKTRAYLLKQARKIENELELCQRINGDRRENSEQTECSIEIVNKITGLREKIESLLNDSSLLDNPFQITKSESLRTVDQAGLQVFPNLKLKAPRKKIRINLISPNKCDDKIIYSYSTVTQGNFGTVYIESDGSLIYNPNSKKPASDTFTVKIVDVDGDSATKTIFLTLNPGDANEN